MHWLRGGRGEDIGDEALAGQLRAAGVPEALIRKQCARREDFEVWPEHMQIVEVFDAMAATQWSVASGMDGLHWIGLRYEALPVVMDLLQVPVESRRDVLAGVRAMEAAARRQLNARR